MLFSWRLAWDPGALAVAINAQYFGRGGDMPLQGRLHGQTGVATHPLWQ